MIPKIALKVDVDTLKGYLEGVPNLLDIFRRLGIRASFFFSFGPDNSGKAVRRVFRKGFLGKMLRTNAPGTYGIKTMLFGTLLPAPLIVPADREIFLQTLREGHECGIHAWDHVHWQDKLEVMDESRMRDDFEKAFLMYASLAGKPPTACAAPAWKVSPRSLAMQDEYGFTYCSDTRGMGPFIPVMNGHVFNTPQIPSTLPTLDEIYGIRGLKEREINSHIMGLLSPGFNVHTVHAEMEGRGQIGLFENLLKQCLDAGYVFVTMEHEAGRLDLSSIPVCEIRNKAITGRAGSVAVQCACGAQAWRWRS